MPDSFTNELENWFENHGVDKGYYKTTCKELWRRVRGILGIRPYHDLISRSGYVSQLFLLCTRAPPELYIRCVKAVRSEITIEVVFG